MVSIFRGLTVGTLLDIIGYLKNPLLQKMLVNLANKTPNKIDDLVVSVIIEIFGDGSPVNDENLAKLNARLYSIQARYDSMSADEVGKLKSEASELEG